MRRSRYLVALLATLGPCIASESVAAEEEWLSVTGTASCLADVTELVERIESRVAGTPNPELTVEVRLEEREQKTAADVHLLSGVRVNGRKHIESASCIETLDAVVADPHVRPGHSL